MIRQLSTEFLLKVHQEALRYSVDSDFIELLEQELERRQSAEAPSDAADRRSCKEGARSG